MFRQVGVKVVNLTKDLAVTFDALPTYGGDRNRESTEGNRRIQWLESKLAVGRFFSPIWATAKLNGGTFRVDGGHSSRMLATTEEKIPDGLQAVIRQFECDSPQDFAELFRQFDPRRSLRTYTDKLKAQRATEDELIDIAPTNIRRYIEGIAFSWSGCGKEQRIEEDERIQLTHECGDFIKWAADYAKQRPMARTGVMAAVYDTYNVDKTEDKRVARKFWDHVANEDHPDKNNATRTLAAFVREYATKRDGSVKWPPRAYYAKAIHAWNAWVNGDGTALRYSPNAPVPKPAKPAANHGSIDAII